MRFATPLRARRRRTRVGGVVVLAATLALAGSWPAPAAVAADGRPAAPGVGEARNELGTAREELDRLQDAVDAAAGAYERAAAHHLRLSGELAQASAALGDADEELATVREQLAARAADAYRRPDAELGLGGAVLAAPDPGTAFHRVALLGTLATSDTRVTDLVAARHRAADRLRHQRILASGTAGSAADLQQRGEALAAAVDDASERVRRARSALAETEVDAQAQAAQRAARLAQAVPAQPAVASPGPAPVADGRVCPVGSPHGFIDSWGYPRSGGRQHEGVDLFAARGTPLYAVADGTIQRVTNSTLGGLSVHLVDDTGDRYYYAHLDTFAVRAGQRVGAGDVVGTVGNTGNARTTPPHLHWQYHPGDGPPVNPYPLARALCRR